MLLLLFDLLVGLHDCSLNCTSQEIGRLHPQLVDLFGVVLGLLQLALLKSLLVFVHQQIDSKSVGARDHSNKLAAKSCIICGELLGVLDVRRNGGLAFSFVSDGFDHTIH